MFSFDNTISTVFIPYLYAIGAVVSALMTPLMLKFILVAHTTECYNQAELKLSKSTNKEQQWLLPLLFSLNTIMGAIAFHHAYLWSHALLFLLITWAIITEVVLQYRLKVISEWFPIVIIWLGLILSISPINSMITCEQTILGAVAGWIVANIIYIITSNVFSKPISFVSACLNPIILAACGALVGLDALGIVFMIAFAVFCVLNFLKFIFMMLLNRINPILFKRSYNMDIYFYSVMLIVCWYYIVL